MSHRVSLRARLVALMLASMLVVPLATGASASVQRGPGPGSSRTGVAEAPVLRWDTCGDDFGVGAEEPEGITFSCAWATVPLDHDRPGDATIQIALKRLHAAGTEPKVGTLFINPGGPGGSGVDLATVAWAVFPQAVLDRFDVVGFDPRGVARSTPLVCFDSFQQLTRTFGVAPPFPIDRTEYRMVDEAYDRYTALCEENAGPIIDHMSTADVARDLDLLRRAVGDDALTYLGYSYGSQLGSVYANIFPGNVRAMVLDGALDPVAWTTGRGGADRRLPFSARLGADVGAYEALGQFFTLCEQAGPDACTLAAQGDPRAVYDDTMATLREAPIRVDLGFGVFEMTYQDLVGFSLGTFYGPFGWAELALVVSEVAAAAGLAPPVEPPAAPLENMPVAALGLRGAAVAAPGGAPMPQTYEGFEGVGCSDSENPRHRRAWWDAGRARDRQAPYFGRHWTWASTGCADWPGTAVDRYMGPWSAKTAAPVLVVGNTYDPATPLSGAQALTKLLPDSRLLTVHGWGHTSIGLSSCASGHVAAYLVSTTLPTEGTTCESDITPFSETVEPVPLRQADGAEQALKEARDIVTEQLLGAAGWKSD